MTTTMSVSRRSRPALWGAPLITLALVGCGSDGVESLIGQLDVMYEDNAFLAEAMVTVAEGDDALLETHEYIEAISAAVVGTRVEVPFVGTVANAAGLQANAEDLAATIVDAMQAELATRPSVVIDYLVAADGGDWGDVEEALSDALVSSLNLTLDDIQPGDFLFEFDDCTKARIDGLDAVSVEIAGIDVSADSDTLTITVDLAAPKIEIDEMRLWVEQWFWCDVRTLEDVSVSLPSVEFQAAKAKVELDGATESYHFPTATASATAYCGETVVLSSTIRDILYGEAGPASAAGLPVPSEFNFSYMDLSFSQTASSALGDLTSSLSFDDVELEISSFWDALALAEFAVSLIEDLIDILCDFIAQAFLSAVEAIEDWLSPDAGTATPGTGPTGGGGGSSAPVGEPLFGSHVAIDLHFESAGGASVAIDEVTWDADLDTILDAVDNCPDDANTSQTDVDYDAIGNACDPVTDMGVLLINSKLTMWNLEATTFARMAALGACIDFGPLTSVFPMAGMSIPPIISVLPIERVDWIVSEMHEMIQRIFDRYKEEWPRPEEGDEWITTVVNEWKIQAPMSLQERQLVAQYLEANRRLIVNMHGENARAAQTLQTMKMLVTQPGQ